MTDLETKMYAILNEKLEKIKPENIRKNINIFGVEGNLEPDKPDQTKTATPTTSQQVIEPDTGYELASVTVNAVDSSIDANIVAGNIKKDVEILGVTGTYKGSGDVKLFNTVNEMQNSSGNQDGDLAIVYENSIETLTTESEFQIATFPETVMLPARHSLSTSFGLVSVESSTDVFSATGSLTRTSFSLYISIPGGVIDIRYTSTNGTTYTRTVFEKLNETVSGNEMNFGTIVKFSGTWNNDISYFIKPTHIAFNGLFQYANNVFDYAKTQFDNSSELIYDTTFYGSNGPVTGSLQNVTDLNISQISQRTNIYNMLSELSLDANITSLAYLYNYRNDLIYVPNINTINIINMESMFSNCRNLASVPNFNTSNVTDMSYMFNYCSNLINVPDFYTNNVTLMNNMFRDCHNLTDIPNFNTSNVTTMSGMFYGCYDLLEVPNFNTSNVADMWLMFQYCRNLVSVSHFDTSKVGTMYGMFAGCYNLINVPNFDTSNVVNMANMFSNCYNLTNIPNFNTSNVTTMESIFNNCYNLTSVSNFDTSNVTTMRGMFRNCYNLTAVPNFNMSNTTNTFDMFSYCNNLTTIPDFDTSNVTTMKSMFSYCENLISVPEFNTSKVKTVTYMFVNCNNLSNESIQNIVNMCINAVNVEVKTLDNTNGYSPLYNTLFDNSYYQNRLTDLTNAGWTY